MVEQDQGAAQQADQAATHPAEHEPSADGRHGAPVTKPSRLAPRPDKGLPFAEALDETMTDHRAVFAALATKAVTDPHVSRIKYWVGDLPVHAHSHGWPGTTSGNLMIIRIHDGLDAAERERQDIVTAAARNVLAKQHSMVAEIDPAIVRKRAIAAARAGLNANVRTF